MSQRHLTKAELQRKLRYEQLSLHLEAQGYRKREFTIGLVQANVMAILIMLPFLVGLAALYYGVNPIAPAEGQVTITLPGAALFLAALLLLLVLHELIHGLTWGLFAPSHFRAISFGVIWIALTPYCTCSEPLKRWQYALGGAMPTLVLGVGAGILATTLRLPWLFGLAELMLLGGGGDCYILLKIARYRPKRPGVLLYDHPYECGFVAFEPTEFSTGN